MLKSQLMAALDAIPGNPPVMNADGDEVRSCELSSFSGDDGAQQDCALIEMEEE
jgi:hypothetical protein